MTEDEKSLALARRRKKQAAALVGVVLAIICHALPAEYQGPCKTILSICGGL